MDARQEWSQAGPASSLGAALTAFSVVVTILLGLGWVAPAASAAPSPVLPRPPAVVTADALPTVQIDGIAWSQAIVNDTVYAGGSFSKARPAGAPVGTNETPRGNLLAYDLGTGNLRAGFAPTLNGQVLAVASSPDGSRIYVGGDFTAANGQPRARIAAYATATGALVSTFAPPIGYQVRAIAATNDTVYVGGAFSGVGDQPRGNLAAFQASTGALLAWAPVADRPVSALARTADGRHVIAGGSFETVDGQSARGLAKLDAVTGARVPWPVVVANAGADAGITSLSTEGNVISGTGYHYGPGGNVEGPFRLDADTGQLLWIADCHGDTYSQFASAGALYVVGHSHDCGNVGGGFPEYRPQHFQRAMAFTKQATGTNMRETHGYVSWEGRPSPSIVQWLPQLSPGTVSGANQGAWHVTGNDTYVVLAGEFPTVNGITQQGLVRFATTPTAPAKSGPAFRNNSLVPELEAVAAGSVKIGWLAGFDRDDRALSYEVVRNPGGVVRTFVRDSSWWYVPALSHLDTGLQPGATYSYHIRVTDGSGNRVDGATRSITVPAEVARHDYGVAVLADGATTYWPLNDASGTFVDHAGSNKAIPGSGVSRGVPGVVPGDTAITLSADPSSRTYARGQEFAPTEMSASVWIKTTSPSGRVLGFGDTPWMTSGHRDRHIYLGNGGRVYFGMWSAGAKAVSSVGAYNDDQWHHVVATVSGSTATLYVDGKRVGQRDDISAPEVYVGQWRLGGDRMSGWPAAGTTDYAGAVDQVAIFPTALSDAQVAAQYALARPGEVPSPTTVTRISGADRYKTAVAISQAHAPGVDTVYLATGTDYPDALAVAAKAASAGSPVLLTRPDTLPSSTAQELTRLQPRQVVVVGGETAVWPTTLEAIDQVTGAAPVTRWAGGNRFATAAVIAGQFERPQVAYVATGANYPDALAGAARAGALDGPVMLVGPDTLPSATAAALEAMSPVTLKVLGGPTVINDVVLGELSRYGTVQRIGGIDRYDTAALISRDYASADTVYVTSGQNWPDALAGAARAGDLKIPVLLTRADRIPPATLNELARLDPKTIQVLGGLTAVSSTVEDELRAQ